MPLSAKGIAGALEYDKASKISYIMIWGKPNYIIPEVPMLS